MIAVTAAVTVEEHMAGPATVEEYLATLPDDRRAVMEQLRATIRSVVPDGQELLSYRMPAVKTHGQFLVSYDAFKKHYSLFPASDAVVEGLGEAVRPHLAGRGTIQFPADRPLPLELIRRIVEIRVAENDAEAERRAAARA
jgi:uncharacterized protein YdhG (YjbR/CyaY superfamily)